MMSAKIIRSGLIVACLFHGAWSLHAQTSVTDGSTPLALAPGAPAGAYRLSDFENINLFSGSLNFRLPLIAVGGRGEAGYTITLPVERHWTVQQTDDPGQLEPLHYANMETWRPIPWKYGAGTLLARKSGLDALNCGVVPDWSWNRGLTRLTFSAPDGTEFELRDQLTGGAPIDKGCTRGVTRGSVFVTADGTAATFVSDTAIDDAVPPYPNTEYGVSGYLRLRNGTRYRIDNGKVSSIRDRNGNLTLFFFDANGRVIRIADSSNREVRISYRPGGQRYDEIGFKGFGGVSRVIRVRYDDLLDRLRSDFPLPAPAASSLFPYLLGVPGSAYNFEVVSAVEIPDGREYRFRYNYYGELARVELPAGGAYEYDFAGGISGGHSSGVILGGFSGPLIYRRLVQRRVYDAGGAHLGRTDFSRPETGDVNGQVDMPPQYPLFETTVQVDHRRPNGSLMARQRHIYFGSAAFSLLQAGPSTYPAYKEGREQRTEYYAANGSALLRKVVTADWRQRNPVSWWTGAAILEPPNDPRPMATEITLADTNQVSRQTFEYDSYNNVTVLSEYDFGAGSPGPLRRRTETAFLATNPANGVPYHTDLNIHLRSLPVRQTVFDGGGARQAETLTEYDVYEGANRALLISRNSISGLDPAFTPGYTSRGNATQIRRWIGGSSWADTHPQYDVAGSIVKIIDPRLKAAAFDYSDRYGAPDGEPQSNTPPAELGGLASFALPTLVTNALGHTSVTQYDYYLGKPVDQEDANAVVSSFFYNDRLDRPTQQIHAAGAAGERSQTSFGYSYAGRNITTRSDLSVYGDNQLKTELVYDGLGRMVESRQYETATAYITTVQTYDALGRVDQVSNPYRPASESQVRTTTQYDGLGRVTRVMTPDGAATTFGYVGNATTVTDPAGKSRRHATDALGRLTELVEAPYVENYSTSYQFDALDNLVRVDQGVQTRTFAYDGLSRLTSATSPESGSVSYHYDAAGNLTGKTDARGTSATFAYDDLNRLTSRSYSVAGGAAATADVAYTYGTAADSCGGYAKGRLCSVSSAVSTTNYVYGSARGLITQSSQETAGQTFNFSYGHNRAGLPISQTYPSGRVVTNAIDAAGRIARVQQGGIYYAGDAATDVQYASHGAIRQMKLGNGLWNETRFNSRLQPVQIGLGTTPTGAALNLTAANSNRLLLELGYGASSNNGSLRTQNIRIGPTTISQNYEYADGLNRLTSASETSAGASWSQTYGHDRYGNLWVSAGAGYGSAPALIPQLQSELSSASNRLTTAAYDAAGNLIADVAGRTFKYDAENRLTAYIAGIAALNATYEYDGDGRRVKKVQDGVTTIFVYDAGGRLAAEYSTAASAPGAIYLTSDHLGSTRAVTDASGAIKSRHDFLPFGEEITAALGNRSAIPGYTATSDARQKFTGKERDSESGLDFFGARYLSAAQGRFMSPDPHNIVTETSGDEQFAAFLGNPQNWNRYSYVLNSPLSATDPDGRCPSCLLWLQQLAQRAAPYANRALLAGQRFGQQAMHAARQGYTWLTQFSNSPAGQEVTSAAAELATGAQLPYGFASAAQFEQFGKTISNGVAQVAGEGAEAFLAGSAVTGKSFITGAAFDVGRQSDFDIALVSSNLMAKAKELGIELRGHGARTGPLHRQALRALGLENLAQRLSQLAGRPVNFMIYETEEDLRRRGAPYQRFQ